MTVNTRYDSVGSRCSGGPTSGARALMSWYLGGYKGKGGFNLGIYNCRNIGGTNTLSVHAEGRAADLGVRPDSARYGWTVANALKKYSKELGIQCIIWDHKIWTAGRGSNWRNYGGVNHHVNHLHVELNRWAASGSKAITVGHIAGTLSGGSSGGGGGSSEYGKNYKGKPGTRVIYGGHSKYDTWSRGNDVQFVQKYIGGKRAGKADGYFGPQTRKGVMWYQKMRGISVDGEVGPQTFKHMGVGWRG